MFTVHHRHDHFHYDPGYTEVKARISELRGLIIQNQETLMASQETLDRLTADVKANTDATMAAKAALEGFVATVADLTAKLQAAIAADDEVAVKAAADAMEANNATLTAATPAVAAAVSANT